MNDQVMIKKCRSCGKAYKATRNPDHGKDKYAMVFINEDEHHKYYSNKQHRRCPTCIVGGKN